MDQRELQEVYALREEVRERQREVDEDRAAFEAIAAELDGGKILYGASADSGPDVDSLGVARLLAYFDKLDTGRACRAADAPVRYLSVLCGTDRIDSASKAAIVDAFLRILRSPAPRGDAEAKDDHARLRGEVVSGFFHPRRHARVALPLLLSYAETGAYGNFGQWAVMRTLLADEEILESIVALAEADQSRFDEELEVFRARVKEGR